MGTSIGITIDNLNGSLLKTSLLSFFWTGLEGVQLFTVRKPGRELRYFTQYIRISYRCLVIARSIDICSHVRRLRNIKDFVWMLPV